MPGWRNCSSLIQVGLFCPVSILSTCRCSGWKDCLTTGFSITATASLLRLCNRTTYMINLSCIMYIKIICSILFTLYTNECSSGNNNPNIFIVKFLDNTAVLILLYEHWSVSLFFRGIKVYRMVWSKPLYFEYKKDWWDYFDPSSDIALHHGMVW